MLRMYGPDLSDVITYQPISLREDLTYEEVPIRFLACKEQVLGKKKKEETYPP